MDVGNLEGEQKLFEGFDISTITNPDARRFAESWLPQRAVNREIYEVVPEDKFDYNITSDVPSIREQLIYQIKIHDNYLKSVKEGQLVQGKHYEEIQTQGLSKEQLLKMLDQTDQDIIDFLSSDNCNNPVIVPWSQTPIPATSAFWGMEETEGYHIGMNNVTLLALKIERPPKLVKKFGK